MNKLDQKRATRLHCRFAYGDGLRAAARYAECDRKTARRYHAEFLRLRPTLQTAYDALWDGDGERCDEINAPLPDHAAIAMLDCWLDDQFEEAKSGWHSWFDGATRPWRPSK